MYEFDWSSIPGAPSGEVTVIAVVVLGRFQGDEEKPSDWIDPLGWAFMPNSESLVVIKGLDDPRVQETLKKIQDARAHPDPDPNAQPATRPAERKVKESQAGK